MKEGKKMLRVVCCGEVSSRAEKMLEDALPGIDWAGEENLSTLAGQRLLFVVPLGEDGVNHAAYDLLSFLRTHPGALRGSVGGIWIDGCGDLYTKALGRDIVMAASLAGCTFPGRALVEGTGQWGNPPKYLPEWLS